MKKEYSRLDLLLVASGKVLSLIIAVMFAYLALNMGLRIASMYDGEVHETVGEIVANSGRIEVKFLNQNEEYITYKEVAEISVLMSRTLHYRVGQKVDILYHPKNPEDLAVFVDFKIRYWGGVLLYLVMTYVGISGLIKNDYKLGTIWPPLLLILIFAYLRRDEFIEVIGQI